MSRTLYDETEDAKTRIQNRIKADQNLLKFVEKNPSQNPLPLKTGIRRQQRQLAEIEEQAAVCARSFGTTPTEAKSIERLKSLIKAV